MRLFRSLSFVLVIGFVPMAAHADLLTARDALKQSCTGDYLQHCSEHPPGGPEVEACFKSNMKKLSPACSSAIVLYKREQKAAKRLTLAN